MDKIIVMIFMILCFITLNVFFILLYLSIKKRYELEDRNIKNKKYELFNSIDIKATKEIVNEFIEDYVNRYAVNKFVATDTIYIRDTEADEMVRNITKNIMLDISELYIYYISLLVSIDNQEDIIRYINTKVKASTISFVANYNSARTEAKTIKI